MDRSASLYLNRWYHFCVCYLRVVVYMDATAFCDVYAFLSITLFFHPAHQRSFGTLPSQIHPSAHVQQITCIMSTELFTSPMISFAAWLTCPYSPSLQTLSVYISVQQHCASMQWLGMCVFICLVVKSTSLISRRSLISAAARLRFVLLPFRSVYSKVQSYGRNFFSLSINGNMIPVACTD